MKKIRIAINGFGRIGRVTFRALMERENCEVVAVNDIADAGTLAHLLKYDSVHGAFSGTVNSQGNFISVNGKKISIISEKDPAKLPWKDLKIDVAVEATGHFTDKESASKHIQAGAKKVVISAPPSGDGIKQIVMGINDSILTKDDRLVSNASCTTNCAAPMVKVLDETWGIERGFVCTTHAFTSDQRLHDAPHKDLRRARAATLSIIPTTTGAAKALIKIFPDLEGKLKGDSYRVPVADGSIADIICIVKKPASPDEINRVFKNASESSLAGILNYSEAPLVSTDIVGNTHSCVFDGKLTSAIGNLVKISGWYDNETGYSHRLAELVEKINRL